jgi:hypothetical protein
MILRLVLWLILVALAAFLIPLAPSLLRLFLIPFLLPIFDSTASVGILCVEVVIFFRYLLTVLGNIFLLGVVFNFFLSFFNKFLIVALRAGRSKGRFVGINFPDLFPAHLQSLMMKSIDVIDILLIGNQMFFLLGF